MVNEIKFIFKNSLIIINILESIRNIENTITHIDSVIEDQEATQSLINLQNSLTNHLPNIVCPSRKIIKEGELMRISSNGVKLKRYCVLMSDMFMYCKILKDRSKNTLVESSLKCSCIFPLKKCKVNELFPGNFKVSCYGDGVIFSTDDINLQKSWVQALKETIERHIVCRKTLRKESSKRKPLRKQKDFENFESEVKRDCDSVFRDSSSSSNDENDDGINCLKRNTKLKRKHSTSILKKSHTATSNQISQPPNSTKYLDIIHNPLSENNYAKPHDEYIVPQKRVRFELNPQRFEINDYPSYSQTDTGNINKPATFGERISKFFSQFF